MNFHLEIPLKQNQNQIDYNSKILLLGSCFAENIGDKFQYFKFQTLQNPFGILFHPLAIETLVYNAVHQKVYTEEDLFYLNEQWHCFDAHSRLSHTSKEQLLARLNTSIIETFEFLKCASHICITLGTAWAYRYLETNIIVANCHKVPQKLFEKELLSIEDISKSLKNITILISEINPKSKLIFTVSPVRHIKDGFVENTLSKAHLISSIHHLIKDNTSLSETEAYFPSYEIQMDELRDYRFYKTDLLHPNNLAVDYIWEKFKQVWISISAQDIMDEVDDIQKGLAHQPLNPNSEMHRFFLNNLESKIQNLKSQLPFIQF